MCMLICSCLDGLISLCRCADCAWLSACVARKSKALKAKTAGTSSDLLGLEMKDDEYLRMSTSEPMTDLWFEDD